MIEYEHEDHFKDILKDLKEDLSLHIGGAGLASDDKVYKFRCTRVGKGKIVKDIVAKEMEF